MALTVSSACARTAQALPVVAALLFGCKARDEKPLVATSHFQSGALRAELLRMGDADTVWIEESRLPSPNAKKLQEAHLGRIRRLKEIIREHGWPTISLVGKDGASAAWITVQHADDDPEFQIGCVPLIQAAAKAGEAELKHMACLTDRALTSARQPQLYGTQGVGGARSAGPPSTPVERRLGCQVSTRTHGVFATELRQQPVAAEPSSA
jgi:hypothetical protein